MEKETLKNRIGIDVGGTTIKGVIIDAAGNSLCTYSVATGARDGGKTLVANVCKVVRGLLEKSGCRIEDVVGVGIGCPGAIDSANGRVIFAGNLQVENFPLAALVGKELNLPVKITNDANAAALGEAKFGNAKGYSDMALITLGTGVGGGIISGGKLFEGYKSVGAELGHTVIVHNGKRCTCGRKGCWEAYASATALTAATAKAMEENKDSLMWKGYTPQTANGKTAFEYMDCDNTARQVVEEYVGYLACGLVNVANAFRPRVIILGGGVCGAGEKLLAPVRKLVREQVFGGTEYADIDVVCATLGNKAGALGAAALFD